MRDQSILFGGLCLLLAQNCWAVNEPAVRVIVKYKEAAISTVSLTKELNQFADLPLASLTAIAGGAYTVTFDNPKAQAVSMAEATTKVLNSLRKNPKLLYAVQDRIGYFKPLPQVATQNKSSPVLSHDKQWDEFQKPAGVMLESAPGLRDGAWAYTTGKAEKPVIVAVLDTGVEFNPGLVNSLVKDEEGKVWGWNFAGNNQDLSDETQSYHGTHVAGTIAGYGDVMLGIGEHLKVLPIKIPAASGMFYESQVINAMYWSVGATVPGVPDNPYPAKVLNMSFGVDERPGKEIDHCDEALQEAVFYVRQQGAVLIAAAGNDNRWEHYNAPAVCNSTMKIASTGPEGLRAYYSNYGPSVSFAAPGGDLRYGKLGGILSTVNPGGGYQHSGFDFYQGTSMASPHAAGVAGLVFAASQRPLTAERVEQILYATTHGFGQSNNPDKACVGTKPCGNGILDAEQAVKAAMADFDEIFSAPSLNKEQLNTCERSKGQTVPASLESKGVKWILDKAVCQAEEDYTQAQLRQVGARIELAYGAVTYHLDSSRFKHCELIGMNGVGCYL